ncbi:hypothetical protein MFLAVUS_010298 [Mucor flavus]|uniref:Uncharacterized protein n=1 Tax=Mucor flavus TaxID=439312 RepID=A0ABP9ZCG2_9FUNG
MEQTSDLEKIKNRFEIEERILAVLREKEDIEKFNTLRSKEIINKEDRLKSTEKREEYWNQLVQQFGTKFYILKLSISSISSSLILVAFEAILGLLLFTIQKTSIIKSLLYFINSKVLVFVFDESLKLTSSLLLFKLVATEPYSCSIKSPKVILGYIQQFIAKHFPHLSTMNNQQSTSNNSDMIRLAELLAEVASISASNKQDFDFIDKPQKYDGSRDAHVIDAWIQSIDDYSNLKDYSSDKKCQLAIALLSGSARIWFSNLREMFYMKINS